MKKVALITGASTGIGRELAWIHAENGGDLIIVARRKDKLEELQKQLVSKYGVEVRIIVKDLGTANAPQEIYDEIKSNNIDIEYLINNAGFGGIGKFHEREWQQDAAMINLNIMALTNLTRLFLPDFIKQNRGRILNVSSTASLIPGPLQAVYFATKAYVSSLSNAIAEELRGTKVTITNLMPGATETEFGKLSGMERTEAFKTTASANLVALDGYNAMLKGKLDVISGLTFSQKILTAILPFMPKKIVLKQIRKLQETKK